MLSYEKTFAFETKNHLKVGFKTENQGIRIIGREEEGTELYVKFDAKKLNEEAIIEKFIKMEFDAEKNILSIDLTELEDEISIRNAKFVLSIPKLSDVIAEVENAPISMENLQGVQKINGENGPIRIEGVNGEIICETENSPISISHCKSNIWIKTENGPIKLKECDVNFELNAENSPVKLIRCSGGLISKTENGPVRVLEANFQSADVKSENGSIYYEFTPTKTGKFSFQNENGKIHLVIPAEVPYKIRAENDFGNFNIGLEGNYDRKTDNDIHIIEMIKEAGSVNISAKNENGSIVLMPNSQKKNQKKRNWNFDDFSEKLDEIMDKIPEGIDLGKFKKKIEKAKKKILKINISDLGNSVQNAMKEIKIDIDGFAEKEMNKDKIKEIKEKVNEVVENIKTAFMEKELSEKERKEVDERSRLKILQMLENGKISADEAERLLDAIKGKNFGGNEE